jgi:hypothetical protein
MSKRFPDPPPRRSRELVRVCSPFDKKQELLLFRDPDMWNAAQAAGDLDKMGEYEGLIHSGMEHVDGKGLHGAHACYQGLMRPRLTKELDEEVCVFITKPRKSATFVPTSKPGIFELREAPKPGYPAVFTVLAEIPEDPSDARLVAWAALAQTKEVRGRILDWEWTVASPKDEDLPADGRYKYRHW